MTPTSDAPIWVTILRNVLISSLAGLLFASLLLPLFTATLQVISHDNYAAFLNTSSLLQRTLHSPLLLMILFPFWIPLVVLACLVGLIFQRSIQKHLVLWCVTSPLIVWLVISAILTKKPMNNHLEQFTWFERFLIGLPSPDNLIFLIGASVAAGVFYGLSRKGLKW